MPLQATSGAASYDAFGGGVAVVPTYIEDVFSTWLYNGAGANQNIVNNIDLSTKGGMVWIKNRDSAVTQYTNHMLVDTVRGINTRIMSNLTNGQFTNGPVSAFNTNGFSLDTINSSIGNESGGVYASWTFRKQPKFFDIVTYTGNGSNPRAISHLLGSTPGCMIVKRTDTTGNWFVYHRSSAASGFTAAQCYMYLNLTNAVTDNSTIWSDTAPTSTTFTVGSSLNTNGATYVAYLFAHDAGGFGLTGTDNVISCGSFTTDGSGNATVSLGYEPQWMLSKVSSGVGDWSLDDVMRGASLTSYAVLHPNTSAAEDAGTGTYLFAPTATGAVFKNLGASKTYIYIAIRRGPMKVPTDATKVFTPQIATSSGSASNTVTTNFPVDLAISQYRSAYFAEWFDRLRGDSQSTYVRLRSASTAAEATGSGGLGLDSNTGYVDNYDWQNIGGGNYVYWNFQRAPSFFDEVCYTGDGTLTRTINHNLTVAPELLIIKRRATGLDSWYAYVPSGNRRLLLNTDLASPCYNAPLSGTTPTATTFSYTSDDLNQSGFTFVAYLFATCAGVSKVGSYTGTGATQTISCGFTGGARWVMVKRTDSTGDWYVWDSARGMVSGTDPSLKLNSTAAEVNANSVYTATGGFQIVSTAAGINASGGTYIFLAIA